MRAGLGQTAILLLGKGIHIVLLSCLIIIIVVVFYTFVPWNKSTRLW
jgi:uncharacterized protein YqfA (UPF0365 family)